MEHQPNLRGRCISNPELPDWVPDKARNYLEHVSQGTPIRELARQRGAHASTVLRHVRHFENRRDDPLVDEALDGLTRQVITQTKTSSRETEQMLHKIPKTTPVDAETLNSEGLRVLRRLAETGAFLIVAGELDRAAVMRDIEGGDPVRIAVLDRQVAQAFALQDWLECYRRGKISHYRITEVGRTALKRMLAAQAAEQVAQGFAEGASVFQQQHADYEDRSYRDAKTSGARKLRYNLAESPLTALGRRADKDGKPFLMPDLVLAGERLREDFELAQMGPRVTQNWDRFLTSGRGGDFGGSGPAEGPMAARARGSAALRDLGPGLGDIALRCCCFLEGMEAAEKRMGWSARSGKIVLRIALQRLKLHYETKPGTLRPRIG